MSGAAKRKGGGAGKKEALFFSYICCKCVPITVFWGRKLSELSFNATAFKWLNSLSQH